ncbi:hypothetical protein [Flaviflexus equikiangi]|uniref:FtsX-like permease family protein n=1 Tax=Flaviflexus equikiangi TaxID=2758573 RepID=A0ABS2TFC7_9ACTO|nr:hypothetical protein [Flaviflexus equikiangi]MBM9433042.1 hypothetical protein [Flaviflexus equikiangi]
MSAAPRLRLTHVIVFALVGLLVLSGAVLGRVGVSRAGDILEENWRGAYDILVTHEDGFESISPGRDANGFALVDDNYAAQTTRIISAEQLNQIDAVESVDLAAPVAFIGRVTNVRPWLYFTRVEHNLEDEPVQDYEITWSVTDDNGVIFERTNSVRIDASRWTGEDGFYSSVGITLTNDFAPADRHILLHQVTVSAGQLLMLWGEGPTVATTIAAVDPVREQELIGESASFLQPLADFDQLIREQGPMTPEEAFGDDASIPPEFADFPGVAVGNRPAVSWQYGSSNPLIGYVRNTEAYGSTVITATIKGAGTTQIDYAEAMRPFNGGTYELPWPDDSRESDDPLFENYVLTEYSSTRLYPPQLTPVESPVDGQAAFSAQVLGIYGPFATNPYAFDIDYPNGEGPGEEITYRNPTGHRLTIGTRSSEGAAPFEVSTFTPGEVIAEGGYVPLGLYGPNTAARDGEPFPPSRHGLGIATQAPSAIVSFEGARQLSAEEDIISAVRVRVSGLDGLSNDDALARINDTAQEIRRIEGLGATVVIGSTMQPVNIWVPLFAHGTDDPDGVQMVFPLGWIEQVYGTLGVASWTAALTNTTVERVAAASILLSSLFLLGLCLLARQERRTTHALLASQGWSTGQRLRWTLGEEWPGLAFFGGAAVIGLLVASNDTVRYAILTSVAVLLLGLMIANPVSARRLAPADRLGTRARMLGLAAAEGLSLGITAAAIGAVGMILHWYYRLVTQTSLGSTMAQALLPVLGAIIVAGAVVIITTVVTARKSLDAIDARNEFSYWLVGRSQAKIRAIGIVPTIIHVLIATVLLLLGRIYAAGFEDDDTLYLVLGAGWILISALTRAVNVLQWSPNLQYPAVT